MSAGGGPDTPRRTGAGERSRAATEANQADVAIVGFGPVGATLANLLGARGMRVAAFDREIDVYHVPRAAHFDGEIMRVFQQLGLADAILPSTATIAGAHFVNAEGKLLFGREDTEPGIHGWLDHYMFYQPDLERALRTGAERYDAVTVHLGHEVEHLDTDTDELMNVTARDVATGALTEVRAPFVVGCDGARSMVRQHVGSGLDDFGLDQPWLVVDTELRREVDLPDLCVQYCDPSRPVTFVPMSGRRRRWEFMLRPGEDPEDLARTERVWELLEPWVGPDDTEIVRAVVYTFHALVAREWRDGRVFLMGDAAHQMPPFLGQGMCAGIRDAANLAWKLDLVCRGLACNRILDTYQTEREPHVRAVIESAVRAGGIIQTADPEVAAQRDAFFLAASDAAPVDVVMPPLGPGFRAEPGGEPLPQTRAGDDALGDGFALVGDSRIVGDDALRFWARIGGRVVATNDPRIRIVRPDRYVFGVAEDPEGVDRLTDLAQASLGEASLGETSLGETSLG
ncbi:MAG: bifunctional 3-(3-hydroxy-phenyl)propionate/3-hydroxycinnamic acid hydroxylase MhpA [Acidimicrobiia bacterium]